jgi:hypothetical protein
LRDKRLLDANQTLETQALDRDKHLRPVRKSNTPPHFLKGFSKAPPMLAKIDQALALFGLFV